MEKTLVRFMDSESGYGFYFELEGDQSRFDKLWLQSCDREEEQKEFGKFMYDGNHNRTFTELREPTKDWDHYIEVLF